MYKEKRKAPSSCNQTESTFSNFDPGLIDMPPSEQGHSHQGAQEEIVVKLNISLSILLVGSAVVLSLELPSSDYPTPYMFLTYILSHPIA